MSNCPFNWTIKLSWHAYWLIVPFGDERQQRYSCPFCSLYLFCQQQFKTIMVHCPLKYFFSESLWSLFFSECGWAVGLAVRKRLLLKMAPGVGLLFQAAAATASENRLLTEFCREFAAVAKLGCSQPELIVKAGFSWYVCDHLWQCDQCWIRWWVFEKGL